MFGGGFQQQQSQGRVASVMVSTFLFIHYRHFIMFVAGFGFGSKPVATPGFGVGANQSFGNSSFGTPDKGAKMFVFKFHVC